MKKSYIVLFVPILFIFFSVKAQINQGLYIGEDNSFPSDAKISQIIGNDESGLYALIQKNPFQTLLIRYDKQYKEEKQTIIELKEKGKERRQEGLILSNNKLFFFSSFTITNGHKRTMQVQTVNKETLELNNDLKDIAYIENDRDGKGLFEISFSKDKSKILIFCDYPVHKYASSMLGFNVFDSDMKKIWSKDISLGRSQGVFEASNYFLENNGNINVVGAVFSNEAKPLEEKQRAYAVEFLYEMIRNSELKKLTYSHCVISYSQDGTYKEFFVTLSKKFIRNMRASYDKEGNLLCTGFYSDKGITSVNGSYFVRINKDSKLIEYEAYNEFSTDFISLGMSKSELEKLNKTLDKGKDPELYQVDLNEVIWNSDGSFILIGQQYFWREFYIGNLSNPYFRKTVTNEIYKDLIVIKVNSTGKQIWAAKVPKKQKIIDDTGLYSSYSIGITKDNLYFLFNDNPLNLTLKEDQEPNSFNSKGDAVVMLAKIDKSGGVEMNPLFSSKQYKIKFCPRLSNQSDEKTLLICGQMYTHYKFGRLTLE